MEKIKIILALALATILAFNADLVSKRLMPPANIEKSRVETTTILHRTNNAKKKAEPIIHLLASANIEKGKRLSRACTACHTFEKGGKNGIGPNQWNVVGQKKEHIKEFKYSGKLTTQGGNTWTYEELNKFLWHPAKYAKGNKMAYAGLKNAQDRADLIAWMRTMADTPIPLPDTTKEKTQKQNPSSSME